MAEALNPFLDRLRGTFTSALRRDNLDLHAALAPVPRPRWRGRLLGTESAR